MTVRAESKEIRAKSLELRMKSREEAVLPLGSLLLALIGYSGRWY
jgi:hypothetical protein